MVQCDRDVILILWEIKPASEGPSWNLRLTLQMYKEEGSVGIIALGSISVRSESLHYCIHVLYSVAPMSIFRVLEDSNWQPSVCENVVSTLFAALHYYNSPFVGVSRCLRNTIRVLLNNPFPPLT